MNMWQAVRVNIKRTTVAAALGLSAGAAAFAQPTLPQTTNFEATPVSGSTVTTVTVDNFIYTLDTSDLEVFNGVGSSGSRALLTFGFGTVMTITADDNSAFGIDSFFYDPCQAYYQIASVTATLSGGGTFTKSSGFPARGSTSLTGNCNEGEGATVTLSEPQFDDVTQIQIVVNYDDGGFSGDFMLGAFDDFVYSAATTAPTVTLSGGGSVSEATASRTITATLSAAASTNTTVNLAYSGTASGSGTDYSAATSITILAGATTGSTNITVVNDDIVETNETVIVDIASVSGGDGATEDGTQQQTFTITNEDTATVTIADASGAENGGPITVTLTIDNAVDGGFDVDVSSVNGTAVAPGDFTAVTNATETFAGTAGETQTFTITPVGDTTPEPNETLTITMGNLTPASVSSGAFDISDTGTVTINNDDSINASVNDPSVAEGASGSTTLTFTVSLDSAALTGGATVDYATSNGTAVAGTDYTATSGTVSFAAGESSKTVDVTVAGDAVVEADETLTLTLSNPTGTGITIGDATGTGTLTNDDSATVTIADVAVNENDGTATVTLTLDNAVDGGFDIDVSTADGTATTADSDYTAVVSATETFAGTAGETQTFTITLGGDTKVEADETISVSMSGLVPVTVASGDITTTDTATVTLNNDDTATITIADVAGNEDDGAITVTATLSAAVDGGFDVDVSTTDGTATFADSDYTAITNQTLTFAGTPGETETFTITPTADVTAEANETVLISMSNLVPVTVGSGDLDITDGATLTINNDDSITASIDDPTVAENSGPLTFTVTLSAAAPAGGATIDYATSNGTATAGSDFTAASGTLSFAVGETSQTVDIILVGDTTVEVDETFSLTLSNPTGTDVTIGDGTGVGTIANDDSAAVTIADVAVNENDGTATVTLTLDNAVDGGFDVNVSTADGTATTADSDYTAVVSATETFAGTAGETQTFTITLGGDTKVEADETISVSMSGLVPVTVSSGDLTITDTATVTLNNDDTATITIADVAGNEDDGAITVTVTLDNAVDGGFDVNVSTADGTATTANSDYTAVTNQTLTFAGTSGESETFTVTPTADVTAEANETIIVTMSGLVPVTVASGDLNVTDTATVTINNDDDISISVDDVAVAEGNTGSTSATFTVSLDAPAISTITVDYATSDGTAIAGSDYTAASGTVTFNIGQSSRTVTVPVTGDSTVELDESATLTLSNPANAVIADATGALTITNDDTTTVTVADLAVSEADGTASVILTSTNAVDGGFQVTVNTADGTATAGADYTAIAGGTATFAGTAGETETVSVTIADDIGIEGSETFTVTISSPVAGTVDNGDITASDTGTVTINDNDSAPSIVSVSAPANTTYVAGQDLDFVVTFSETVNVVGIPQLSLTVGASSVIADFATGSGSSALTFTYTVQTGDEDTDGVAISSPLVVGGGSIQDGDGNNADLILNGVASTAGVLVDAIAPSAPSAPDLAASSDLGTSDSDDITADDTPTLLGSAEANASVEVFSSLDGSLGTTTANGVGAWTFTPGTAISEGEHEFTAEASDTAGNTSPASGGLTVTIDVTPPTLDSVDLFAGTVSPTDADVVSFQAVFSEDLDLTTISGADFVSTGTTATPTSSSVSNSEFEISLAGGDMANLNATVTVALAASPTISDIAGNALVDTAVQGTNNNSVDVLNDTTPPDVTITTASAGPVSGAFSITIEFTESVTGFAVGDLTVGNGAASNFAGSGDTYTADVTPSSDGTVTVDVAAGVAQDAAGNTNTAATQFSIESDGTAPGLVISTASADPVSGTFAVTFTFDEAVTGFAVGDITVGNGAAGNFAGSGDTYTADITPTADGTVTVDVAAGVAQDAAGNDNTAATQFSILSDGTAPGVVISTASADPASGTFAVTFTFDEAVTGFAVGDISVGNGSAGNFAGSGDTYTADITPTADGTVTVDVAAGVAQDAAGNDNTAATQFSIESDGTAPGIAITTASADPVSGVFSVTFTFDEAVTGFAVGDITVGNGSAGNFAGSGDTYTADITPAADGTVTVDVAAGVAQDAAGNPNTAATQFSIEADGSAPEVVIASAAIGPVNAAFSITVDFTEAVTGFDLADLIVSNGTASSFAGSGASYTADITPTSDGFVTVEVLDAVAQDAAGNDNAASEEPFSIEFDGTQPELSITTVSSDVSGPFEATFTFTEDVTGFELADIIVDNGAASALSGSGAVYTATITPDAPGPLFIDVAAGAAVDAADNDNVAGQTSVDVVTQAPTVVLVLSSSIANPGDVAGTATLSNPGSNSLPFSALADVSWIDVTPSSGTIPGLADLDLTIALNDEVNSLEPGVYNGIVTVTLGTADATPTSSHATTQSTVTQLDIPIELTVEERFGTVELVATTPAGASGDAAFGYTSDLAAFDGLTLTTASGRASAVTSDVLFGSYAITQSAPAGWRVESISCAGDTDGGSTFDAATGQATLDIDAGEALVCTFQNVRDEDAVRIATQRAIRNFMARRADRIVAAAPDFSQRFSERESTERGSFAADMDGSGRSTMAFSASLSGMRNAAEAATPEIAGVTNYERPFAENWDVWLAAEFASVKDNRAGDDARSDFAVTQLGIDYQVSDTLILGVMAQYDWMDEVSDEINTAAGAIAGAQVEGSGWMAGPYGVWKLADTLTFDALAMFGTSDNTVNPLGLYEDNFETDRYMLRANLTGEFGTGNWRIRPQANLTHFEETQGAYTDSLNIAIPEQTLTLGRITAGPEVAWMERRNDGSYLELTSSVRAVWDYQAADLLNEAGLLVDGADDMRADARVGIGAGFASGMNFRFEAGFAGLGVGDFEATTARFQLRIPFGASGRGGGGGSPLGAAAAALGQQQGCDDPAGQGFAYAAGQMNRCENQGLGRLMR